MTLCYAMLLLCCAVLCCDVLLTTNLHMTVSVQQEIGRLHITMKQVSRVEELESFHELPNDVPGNKEEDEEEE